MIVVVGQPFARRTAAGWVADGSAVRVAAAAVEAGGRVELLGRIGEDEAGEGIVLDCARRRIGHAALIRSSGRATPVLDGPEGGSEPLGLDDGDVELGLRYFVDLAVVAVVDPLPSSALEAAARIAAAQDAALIVATERGATLPDVVLELSPRLVVLETPGPEGRAAFDALVGRLAAGLAAGERPADAFRAAVVATGWEPAVRARVGRGAGVGG